MKVTSTWIIVSASAQRRPGINPKFIDFEFNPSGEFKCANRDEGNQCCEEKGPCFGIGELSNFGACYCDEACIDYKDCCDDHVETCPQYHLPNITNIEEMANYTLDGTGNGGFVSTDGFNYGCAGRDFYNPNSITVGKQVDEVDKRFYMWKKCVQCALKSFNVELDDISYDYDLLGDSCGTNLNHLSNFVKLYLSKLSQ